MEGSLRNSDGQAHGDAPAQIGTPDAASRQAVLTTAVGASYAFDPGVDGLASIYAARVLDRGIDPRALCAEIRADRLGLVDRAPQRRALLARTRTSRFGRGTADHLRTQSSANQPPRPSEATLQKRPDRAARPLTRQRSGFHIGWSRKLAAAGLAALLLLPLGVIVANAQDAPPRSRYVAQPGDTLDNLAGEFAVEPAAILAASSGESQP
jgi:hypothetical protein